MERNKREEKINIHGKICKTYNIQHRYEKENKSYDSSIVSASVLFIQQQCK